MLCDACNSKLSKGTGEKIPHHSFIYLLENGLCIDQTNINLLIKAGMTRKKAEASLMEHYRKSKTDWLLCPACVQKGIVLVNEIANKEDNEFIDVTKTAAEVGHGYDTKKCSVGVTHEVWKKCIQWGEKDQRRQGLQEQDARLWQVLCACGGTLKLSFKEFEKNGYQRFLLTCIIRDGLSTEAQDISMIVRPKQICGRKWLVIDIE